MKTSSVIVAAGLLLIIQACGKNDSPAIVVDANFSISGYEVPAPCTITFINTSQNATSYLWDFGDGSTSTQPAPVHTYALDGTYPLRLKATGANGADSVCKLVSISAPPAGKSAMGYFFDRCSGSPVGGLFKTVNPLSTNVIWDFGNGSVAASRDAIVQFVLPGDYTVKHSSQINGVRDTLIRIIQIQ
ncbi:MAG: PKD domain-containing protein [Chitinophagaceae bacterium]